jgi:O-acetyl-ADP-ribose deacetylase
MKGIKLFKGDITKLRVDAIVNAANSSLLGGGGVDGSIHRAAGPELLVECRTLNGCQAGEAKITHGYNLPAKYVIHTVGPIWYGGQNGEPEVLRNCYLNCLSLAGIKGIKSIAFPNISTGVYGYPKKDAAEVAINTIRNYISVHPEIEEVIFAIFDEENFFIYKELLK